MKYFVAFGQAHVHSFNGLTFDKDCVATVETDSYDSARTYAFQMFGNQWLSIFRMNQGEEGDQDIIDSYPRGEMPI